MAKFFELFQPCFRVGRDGDGYTAKCSRCGCGWATNRRWWLAAWFAGDAHESEHLGDY